MAGSIPAGERLNRARGGAEQERGEAREFAAWGNRAGRQATAGAASGGTALLDELDPSRKKERKGRRKGNGVSGKDKDELVRTPRFAAMADAWHLRRSVAVWASGNTVEHRR